MKQSTYTAKDIERYHGGELSAAEMHALERAALDDLFLADALEGYPNTKTAATDLTSLQQKLQARIQNEEGKRKVFFIGSNWMKIAALFILFAGGGWLVFQMFSGENKSNELATAPPTQQKTTAPLTQITTLADSVEVHRDMPVNNQTVLKEATEKKDVTANTDHTVPPSPQMNVQTVPSTHSSRLADSTKDQIYEYAEITAPVRGKRSDSISDRTEAFSKKESSRSRKVPGIRDTIKNLDVVLQPSQMALDEVVVVNQNKTVARQDAKRKMQVTVDKLEPAEGWTNFGDYIATNMRSPEELRTKPTNGEVELSFEVNKQGEPVNITIEQSLCEKCDAEAIRLLKEGPRWKNNKKRGTMRFSF